MSSATVVAVVVALAPVASGVGGTQRRYDSQTRIEQLTQRLDAIREASTQELLNARSFVDAVARNDCSSAFARLRASCLIQATRKKCGRLRGTKARQRCLAYSDTLVVNKLSEKVFLTVSERFRLMKSSKDFRRALRAELKRRRGSIVAEFSLRTQQRCEASDARCLSQALDAYCQQYSDKRELSWHHCVAAVVWFVGTAHHADFN